MAVITRPSGNDAPSGTSLAEIVYGLEGDDTPVSGGRDETLRGDAGDDNLSGRLGDDEATGASGSDPFSYIGTSSATT